MFPQIFSFDTNHTFVMNTLSAKLCKRKHQRQLVDSRNIQTMILITSRSNNNSFTSKCCKYDKGCCSVGSTLQPAAGRESAAEPDPDEWSLGAGGTNSDVSEGREGAVSVSVSCHVITHKPFAARWWLRDQGTRDSAGPSSILSQPGH